MIDTIKLDLSGYNDQSFYQIDCFDLKEIYCQFHFFMSPHPVILFCISSFIVIHSLYILIVISSPFVCYLYCIYIFISTINKYIAKLEGCRWKSVLTIKRLGYWYASFHCISRWQLTKKGIFSNWNLMEVLANMSARFSINVRHSSN